MILENILCDLRRMCILVMLDGVSCVCQVHLVYSVIQVCCFLTNFYLDDLFYVESGVLKTFTFIVFLSMSPFSSVNICFEYLGVPVLKKYDNYIHLMH